MQMTFRWYGEGNDRIKLSDIKQIPGVKGILWALHDKNARRSLGRKRNQCRRIMYANVGRINNR